MGVFTYDDAIRFWSTVNIGLSEHCWEWKGHRRTDGYGLFSIQRDGGQRFLKTHRVAFEIFCGPIPQGLSIRHTCDNRPCVNPTHLLPGTHAENMADMKERGRAYRAIGELAARSKLLPCDVREIVRLKREEGLGSTLLSRKFGVSRSSIKMILCGRSWGHITGITPRSTHKLAN